MMSSSAASPTNIKTEEGRTNPKCNGPEAEAAIPAHAAEDGVADVTETGDEERDGAESRIACQRSRRRAQAPAERPIPLSTP
jgi:hypothetical protein